MQITFYIMRLKISPSLPLPVRRSLKKVGTDIADARKRRRISTETLSQRASITRPTLSKIENGDPNVSIGRYATVLFVLGILDRLKDIADPSYDQLGIDLESEKLPKRIYQSRRK